MEGTEKIYMSGERHEELLLKLMDAVIDRMELDGAMELFGKLGFTEYELKELGYCEE